MIYGKKYIIQLGPKPQNFGGLVLFWCTAYTTETPIRNSLNILQINLVQRSDAILFLFLLSLLSSSELCPPQFD